MHGTLEAFVPEQFRSRPTRTSKGVRFQVWAPKARQVELVLITGNEPSPTSQTMVRSEFGYWYCDASSVESGTRYAYRLQPGGPLRPDPASVWQPQGVHHPSALYFCDDYVWHDDDWKGVPKTELAIYELHIGTFTEQGTFDAAIPRIAELKELGVTAIEVMPVCQFPGTRNWGYDGAHLFATQNSYGGPAAFQRFVDAAHQAGLAVLLDLVLNHFGPEGNYVGEFGTYYSSHYSTPWGPAFNFDGRDCDPVRMFVLENIWHWISDFHLDGLRLDAVHAMFDSSPVHILTEIKQCADAAANRQGRTATIIAESLLNDVRMVQPRIQGGHGLDAEWNEDFHHALVAYWTGERHGKYLDFGAARQFPEVLEKTFSLAGTFSKFRGRRWGAPAGNLSGDHFVIGTQNHDHVGNRACGERLSQLVSPAVLRLSASLMLLSPYLPLIFMGEEYGESNPFLFFCSFEDTGLIANVREGRARDYALSGPIPDPQSPSTFEASKLSWNWSDDPIRNGLRVLYQDLLTARKTWPELQNFQQRSSRLWPDAHHATILELIRGGNQFRDEGTLGCFFNLSDLPQALPLVLDPTEAILFRSEQARYGSAGSSQEFQDTVLQPCECVVIGPPRRDNT